MKANTTKPSGKSHFTFKRHLQQREPQLMVFIVCCLPTAAVTARFIQDNIENATGTDNYQASPYSILSILLCKTTNCTAPTNHERVPDGQQSKVD